jgi:hypothetical protein
MPTKEIEDLDLYPVKEGGVTEKAGKYVVASEYDIYKDEIIDLQFLDNNIVKRVAVCLLSICTCGLFALVLYWFPTFRA